MQITIPLATLVARFEQYISFNTQSNESSTSCPSTPGQLSLAQYLVQELQELGLTDVRRDANGYIMATLPANGCPAAPVVGFIAHMDTSPDMAGGPVHARIVDSYDGGDIVLNATQNIILSPTAFPELLDYQGQAIMVTDGTTLLGADDKAGLAAIVSALEYLLQHPELKHGKLRIGFTPDEEIGRGADHFDVASFGADWAYTIDGDAVGGLEYENFNAASATVTCHGRNVHPGAAKGKMLNAITLATEWQNLLPPCEVPEHTEGYEGFYHVHSITGTVEQSVLQVLVRDHNRQQFEAKKAFLQTITDLMNSKYGPDTVSLDLKDSYYNMGEIIKNNYHIVELAQAAMQSVGIKPHIKPIRGGTDGARLSSMGLPCPNIFSGGLNFHGKYEYLPLHSLQKATATIVALAIMAGTK